VVGSRCAASMNRTTLVAVVTFLLALGQGSAQEPAKPPADAPQADPIEAIVADIRSAERAAKTVAVELVTSGNLPGDLSFATSGTLYVLRGTQPKLRTTVEFSWANGVVGRMETLRTADGITIYQDDPAFGEVLVRVPPALVADLEWAGEVLKRADLPGMKDGRAEAPLGSSMLDDLRRHFDLKLGEGRERAGEAGQWLVGERRPGLGDQDPDLPLADHVKAFVRQKDHAVLEVVHYQGEQVLQRIEVKKLEVDGVIAEAVFSLDRRGLNVRDAEEYPPMREQIRRTLEQAESKAGPDALRPSKRK
jgi:hypothetical protein